MRVFFACISALIITTFILSLPAIAQNSPENIDESKFLLNIDEVTTVTGSVVEEQNGSLKHRRRSLSSRGGEIVKTAQRYMGVPYLWAGTTDAGFDCSGFVMKVFSLNGLNIRRMADEQYYKGAKVSRADLDIGDLVFFTTYGPGVTHVGIYIGDDKFIHASSRRGVTISSLNESYYKNRFIGGCRYW